MPTRDKRPTSAELEILSTLWKLGKATVREIHTELSKTREVGYTTTLKLMQIMAEKGLLIRDESSRSHVYRPKQPEGKTQKQLLKHLLFQVFGGSTEKLVLQALSVRKADPGELSEIRRMLDELEGGGQ